MNTELLNKIHQGEALAVLKTLPSESVDCVVTSPPYWALRDYGVTEQLGLESTPEAYIDRLCTIFDEVKRVLTKDGTCWVNLGDTYGGFKQGNTETNVKNGGVEKSLCQIPSRFAIEMTNRGWILRNEIIWYKRNAMPQSATDRFTIDFEKMFFFTKSQKYFFKQQLEPIVSTPVKRTGNGRSEYQGKWNGKEDRAAAGSPRA